MLRCSGREVLFKQIVIFFIFIFILFILAIFSASINHTGALWDVVEVTAPTHFLFLSLTQPLLPPVCLSLSPPSCQIKKAFRISRDPAPHWFTDCQPPTNHSIPVSTYNSSVTLCLLHLISHHYVSLHLTHLLLFASSLLLCALLFYFCLCVTLHFPCSHFTCFFFNFCYSHSSSFSVSPLFMFSSCPRHLRPIPFSLSVHFFDFSIPNPLFPFAIYLLFSSSPLPCLPSLMPGLSVSASLPPQYLQRRQQENAQRQSRGEPPLPEEDISKLFKPPQPPPRMDTLLIAGMHANTHSHILRV